MNIEAPLVSDAVIEGDYRYILGRRWGEPGRPHVNFVMLNPSTADASEDDPTIRRCVGFASSLGYAGLIVTNLYAYRATDPRVMAKAKEPVGPRNDEFISYAASRAGMVICAWGSGARSRSRVDRVLSLIRAEGRQPMALRITKDGHPCHPLYLPANLRPFPLEVGR